MAMIDTSPGLTAPAPRSHASRATFATRVESAKSLNFAPTPPWATRALCEVVLPRLGVDTYCRDVWEPACGEGHMTAVLHEYFAVVFGTDIKDYRLDGRAAPRWCMRHDFFETHPGWRADWIITNPPFGRDVTTRFVERALDLANGVAMFLRSQWIVEGIGRYETIFRDRPPTQIAFFAERVPLHMGRYEPNGRTMTAYCWVIWIKGKRPRAPFWIPPGQRKRLTRPDDAEMFTAHPVIGRGREVVA